MCGRASTVFQAGTGGILALLRSANSSTICGKDESVAHLSDRPDAKSARASALTVARAVGMVIGMATTKLTITLDDDQLEEVRRLVAAGKAASISGFVKHAVGVALHDAAGWREMLADALLRTGGPLTKRERAWADSVLVPRSRKRGSRRRKAA
jgi:Arc/MetJ-type ribon-helix-helix transcriptional regulator